MSAAAGYVAREYGESGYSIGLEGRAGMAGGLFRVHCSDGSEFHVIADRWGVVTDVRSGESVKDALVRMAAETDARWTAIAAGHDAG